MDPLAASSVTLLGDPIRHIGVNRVATFELSSPGISRNDLEVSVLGPSKRPVSFRLLELGVGDLRLEFTTQEVGNYFVEVSVGNQKIPGTPWVAKAYDASLIRVSDVPNGVVGQPCQFKVDASQAGEGQLEISICEGEVPNHVQVLGGGRCLVSFTPERPMQHSIDIKFNGDTVPGCPLVCQVTDTSRVSVNLRHLELIPVNETAHFTIHVDGTTSAELAVSVRAPSMSTLPVKVTGNTRTGFKAEFVPKEVGAHTVLVEYNGSAVGGTPFTSKVYDSKRVYVSPMPRGAIGKALQFTVDAGQAGEGNLEITISAKGRNIPTQVHPQGNARFVVSFVPLEATDHTINISFNKEPVPGSPFIAHVSSDPNRLLVSGQSLASSPVGKPAYFTISNVTGTVEDVEVNVEGETPYKLRRVPAQLTDLGDRVVQAEFTPRVAGEHRIHVLYGGEAIPGSPFSSKVYDVSQIKVRENPRGVVGRPVTFIVETSQAGPGNLEVTVNAGQVPTSAQSQGHHTYAISFTPKEPRPHVVQLKFNGEDVPGSPFTCHVADASRVTASGDGLEKVPVDHPAVFYIHSEEQDNAELAVRILNPARQPIQHSLTSIGEGRYTIEYLPTDVGDHTVEVRYAELPIPGSPFLVKAYDSRNIRVTDITTGVVGKPVYFSIDASQAGAGNLEIIVSVSGRNVPNYVQSEGNAKFKVNFKPQEPATHIISVRFNGEPVPGSPFGCRVTDSSLVMVSGDALKMAAVNRLATFSIDPRNCDITGCSIKVLSPLGTNIPVDLKHNPDGVIEAQFLPTEVGPHTISLILDDEHIGGSPFTCNVYAVENIRVSGLENTKVGRPVTFTVDASQAGEGTLELVVMTAKASVRAEVTARSRGLYDVTFTPLEAIPHFVNITFNEEDVPGSPFKCDVRELDAREMKHLKRSESKLVSLTGDGLKEAVVGSPATFDLDPKSWDASDLDVIVTSPDESRVPCRILRLRSGLLRAEYRPQVVGLHRVEVEHKGKPASKQPFLVEVAEPSKVLVTGFEEKKAVVGKDFSFKVDASKAGRGTVWVRIRAASEEVKYTLKDLGWGLYDVLFTPVIDVPHRISLKYNGVPIAGSPYELVVKNPYSGKLITASGLGLHQSRVGKPATFVIETLGRKPEDFDVVVSGPGSSAIPVKCYQQKDGNLLAEFSPYSPGAHKVEVYHSGTPIHGSPFRCQVYDASKVRIEEPKSSSFYVNDRVAFKVDHKKAGEAELSVTVSSPVGRNLPLEVKPVGETRAELVEFRPPCPGKYKLAIWYGDEEVPGSPVVVICEEEGGARAYGEGLSRGRVGTPATFHIQAQGLGEPHVQVDGPDSVAKSSITAEDEDGLYAVSYIPQEVGIFDVTVMWNGKELPGSPFHPKVVEPRKVRVIGGWESLVDDSGRLELFLGQEKKISFDVSDAGPGKLRCEIKSPKETVEGVVEQTSPSRHRLVFTPMETGENQIYLYWMGYPLPKSPLVGIVEALTPGVGDHSKITLKGHGLAMARCNEEAEFLIDGSSANTSGVPEVTLSGIKSDIRVKLEPQGNNVFRAVYVPTSPGAYLLNVTWAGRQVKGCPLKVTVASSTDASKVLVTGEGLRGGVVGKDIRSFIDTRRAGPGELTAHCAGPSKVAFCELYDHGDGTFTLNVKPAEQGRHMLTIKYGGEHVPGSPFPLRISGAPDASKVRVYGPGIEPGVLATFQSRFLCDTRGAGAGQLTVRIRGPKGAFRVEMQRESQKDRTILCRYNPTEPGDYRVEVKWSGEHVPGSPFMVMIFDTQEELQNYLQERTHSPGAGAGASVDAYGSVYGHMSLGHMSWRGSQPHL